MRLAVCFAKITTHEYVSTVKTTKMTPACFATLTEDEKRNLFKSKKSKKTKDSKCAVYRNIRNSSHHSYTFSLIELVITFVHYFTLFAIREKIIASAIFSVILLL